MPPLNVTAQLTPRPFRFVSLVLALAIAGGARAQVVTNDAGDPLVSTFSIVAVDTTTGEMGVAVQSKFPNVRAVVPWAEAGVGAVATQSFARLDYGRKGLELMRLGATAPEALAILLREDPAPETRQVGMVDARGNAASWTGSEAFEWRGGQVGGDATEAFAPVVSSAGTMITGDGWAAQGNILVSEATVEAMARTFETTDGTLGDRLLAALLAGGAAGGDKRGEQSAALVVVRPGAGYDGDDRTVDISVYDHPTPLAELARLYTLNDLYFTDSDPADMVEVTPKIARELQEIWTARGFYDGPADGRGGRRVPTDPVRLHGLGELRPAHRRGDRRGPRRRRDADDRPRGAPGHPRGVRRGPLPMSFHALPRVHPQLRPSGPPRPAKPGRGGARRCSMFSFGIGDEPALGFALRKDPRVTLDDDGHHGRVHGPHRRDFDDEDVLHQSDSHLGRRRSWTGSPTRAGRDAGALGAPGPGSPTLPPR